MKAKKILVIITGVLVFAIVAAIVLWPKTEEHVHSFNKEYTYNNEYHWQAASCEHSDMMNNYEAHTYNEMLVCEVCNYQGVPESTGQSVKREWLDFDLSNSTILLKRNNEEVKITVTNDSITESSSLVDKTLKFFDDYYEIHLPGAEGTNIIKVEAKLTALGYLNAEYPELHYLSDALQELAPKCAYNEKTNSAIVTGGISSIDLPVYYKTIMAQIEFKDQHPSKITTSLICIASGVSYETEATIGFGDTKVENEPEVTTVLEYEFITSGPNTGTYIITGWTEPVTELIIPSEIHKIPVTAIADKAFKNTKIEKVIIPGTVQTIGVSAFESCKKLTFISLENGVKTIGKRAFALINSNYEIHMYDSIRTFGKDAFLSLPNTSNTKNWYYYGDINHYATSTFGEGESTPGITHTMYVNKERLTNVKISTATSISDYAFSSINSIKSYHLGRQVQSIGKNALFGKQSTGSGNTYKELPYSIYYDGDIYDWIDIALDEDWALGYGYNLYFGEKKVILVELDGTIVPKNLFNNCRSLSSIILTENVTTISEGAFKYCDLIDFDCTNNLKIVEKNAFSINFRTINMESSSYSEYNGAYYLGTRKNPYYICIEIYDTETFILHKGCQINAVQ